MFVRAEPSPWTRFQRALSMGHGLDALEAAAEIPKMKLVDALRLTLLLTDRPDLFERYASRWLARFAAEVPGLRISETALAAAAFAAIREERAAGAVALAGLCEERGRRDLARVLEEWCEPWRD